MLARRAEIEFAPLRDAEARAWVVAEAKRSGCRLDPRAADLLVELVGTDLATLRRNLEVLALSVGELGNIDEEAVSRMVAAARINAI